MALEPPNVIPIDQAREVRREPPRPLIRAIDPPAPFPLDALRPLASGARAIEAHTQAPAALVAQSVLGAASLAAQAHADILHPATDAPCPLSLFMLSIGESGERKTAVDSLALKPVREKEEALARCFKEEMQSYETELGLYGAKKDAAKAEFKKSRSIDAEADLRAIGPAPEPPMAPLLTCEDPTFEGFVKLTALGRPALGIFSSEGGAFIGGYGMSQDQRLKTAAGLSSVWDGAPIKRVRAGDGATMLLGRRLAMHLMAQPQASLTFLGARDLRDQGLFSRVLTVFPESTMGLRLHREPSAEARDALREHDARLRAILEREPPLMEETRNSLAPRRLSLDPAAKSLALSFHDDVERQLGENGPLRAVSGFASKAVEHAVRIAGVMTIFHDVDAVKTSVDSMEAAIRLVEYYLAEQIRLREQAAIPEPLIQAERLWRWISEVWSEPAIHAAAVYQKGPGRDLRNRRAALKAIAILEEHGYLWRLETGAMIDGTQRREAWGIWGREGA